MEIENPAPFSRNYDDEFWKSSDTVELEKWGMNIQVKEELALLQFFKQIVQLHVAHNQMIP